MTSPLLPIGAAALGSFALKTVGQLNPGEFLRELWNGNNHEPAAEIQPSDSGSATRKTTDLTLAIPSLVEHLRTRLQSAGVQLSQPITLKEDGWGGVVVDGDHPDRLAIEELFASDQELRAEFQTISQAATSERDRLASGFGPSLGEFRLQIDRETAAIAFE